MPQTLRSLTELPDEVRLFLLDPSAFVAAKKIVAAYKLSEDSVNSLLDLAEDVTLGRLELADLPIMVTASFGVGLDASRQIAIDLAGYRLLPIASLVGDVAGQITAWGGDLNKFKTVKPVNIHLFSAENFVRETLGSLGIKMPSVNLQSRLEFILVAFAKGVRDENETKAVLIRSPKVGGMDFTQQAADDLLSTFVEKMKAAKVDFAIRASAASEPDVVSGSRPAVPLLGGEAASDLPGLGASSSEDEEDAAAAASNALKTIGQDAFGKRDAEEIARAANALKKDIGSEPPTATMEEAIKHVLTEVKMTFKDEFMRKRFVDIATARLRDVRDGYETRARLEDAVEKGGMGLAGAELVRVDQIVEHVFNAWKKNEQMKREEVRAQAKAEKHPEPVKVPTPVPTPSAAPVAVSVPAAPLKVAPKPIAPRLSAASVPPTTGRPKMEDVKFTRRLAGPVEELASLGLIDFRRLSKDPHEAAMKIKAKIDLLEGQGYEKKIAGIKAWRESPVNRLYLDLSRQSLLSGRSVQDLAAEHQARGEESLSAPELGAILELNSELRF